MTQSSLLLSDLHRAAIGAVSDLIDVFEGGHWDGPGEAEAQQLADKLTPRLATRDFGTKADFILCEDLAQVLSHVLHTPAWRRNLARFNRLSDFVISTQILAGTPAMNIAA